MDQYTADTLKKLHQQVNDQRQRLQKTENLLHGYMMLALAGWLLFVLVLLNEMIL